MEMPVNSLQQAVARLLLAMHGQANKLWILFALAGTLVLIGLALVSFVPGPVRERWKRRRLFAFVLTDGFFLGTAIATLVVLRLPILSQLELNPDECGLVLGARTLLHDPRFWISFENTTLGPLSTFSLVPIGLLGFPIDFTTIRVVGILIWAAVIVLIFLGLRSLYAPMWARVLSLPTIAAICGLTYSDYVAFNGEHMAVLMLALAFFFHAPLLRDTRSVRPGRAVLFGCALALVPLAKVQPGPLALVWGFIAVAHALFRCRPRAIYYCLGAAIPVALLALYLVSAGATYDFWQSYVLNNLLYASDGWNATQKQMGFWQNALGAPFYILHLHDTRGLFVFTGLLVSSAAALALASQRMRRRFLSIDAVLGLSATLAAVVCVLMPKNNWTHYLLLLLVPVTLLNAAVLAVFFEQARARRLDIHVNLSAPEASWLIRGNVFVAALVALLGVLLPAAYTMKSGHPANAAAAANLEAGRTADPVTAAILRYARPGEPVAQWGVRFHQLARAGVSMGTRDAHLERALYPSRQQKYYLDRFIADVLARKPEVLVDTNDLEIYEGFRLPNFPEQWDVIRSRYRFAEEVEGHCIYVRRHEGTAGGG